MITSLVIDLTWDLEMPTHFENICCHLIDLPNQEVNVILGETWLKPNKANLNYESGSVIYKHRDAVHTLYNRQHNAGSNEQLHSFALRDETHLGQIPVLNAFEMQRGQRQTDHARTFVLYITAREQGRDIQVGDCQCHERVCRRL